MKHKRKHMKIDKMFASKEVKRNLMINIRVSEDEMKIIKDLSKKYTEGNVTRFVRKAIIDIIPDMLKSDCKGKR